MRKFLLLLILFVPTSVFAQEYGPHVKITFESSSESREFSGTIIESEESKIDVLTCWHATMGFTNPKTMTVRAFTEPIGNTRLSAIVTLNVQKSDDDKDIILLSGPNTLNLKFKRMKIGKNQLVNNAQTLSYGYSQSDRLIINKSSIIISNKGALATPKGATILRVNSPIIYGMSGGGLVYDGELYGVQSSGKNGVIDYCPANQLVEFVNEH